MALNFTDKAGILGELWINFRDDENFEPFIDYNDMGLPLAYAHAEGLITEFSPLGEQYIIETFDMLMNLFEVTGEELDTLSIAGLTTIMDFAMKKKLEKPKTD
jgi:hypothetical protein